MSKIAESLSKLFERNRIIFWYDEGRQLREEFDALDLSGVEKRIIANNEFTLKVEIHRENPQQRFLVYSPNHQPDDAHNWLLDLNIAGYLYGADKASMLIDELGLDPMHKGLIQEFDKFFNAQSRRDKLSTLITKESDASTIKTAMLSILCGCEPRIEAIILRLLTWVADESDKASELSKYGLEPFFFDEIRRIYRYESPTPSLKDFAYALILAHFYSSVAPAKTGLNVDAVYFAKHQWIDSQRYRESFILLSRQVEENLNIKETLDGYTLQQLTMCDTFESIDKKIIVELRNSISSSILDTDSVITTIREREKGVWFDEYRHLYKSLEYASMLLQWIKCSDLKVSGLKDGFERYVSTWYEADTLYRKALYHSTMAEHLDVLKPLMSQIENSYLNGYLITLGDAWQTHVNAMDSWSIPGLTNQCQFFEKYVAPQTTNDRKVYVIISDAFRYECAKELEKRLLEKNRYQCSTEAMLGVLPSYTQLGIASLLPHKELAYLGTDDTVYIDGKSSAGVANRNKILAASPISAVYTKWDEFIGMSREAGRDFVKGYQVFYIYHDRIDAIGDDAKTESHVFEAVEKAYDELEKIITQVTNLNGTNIIITADHGFLYQNNVVEETDLCQIDRNGSTIAKYNRRFVLGYELNDHACVKKFSYSQLGIVGEGEALIPKSVNKLRLQGAGNRFVHGGASLQEIVVPVVLFSKKRKDDIESVDVDIVKSFSRISSNQITLTLWQKNPIGDKVLSRTLFAGFYVGDELVSNEEQVALDSSDEDSRNREVKVKFHFIQTISKYNNQTVSLKLTEFEPGTSRRRIYKQEQFGINISFVSEFDEF